MYLAHEVDGSESCNGSLGRSSELLILVLRNRNTLIASQSHEELQKTNDGRVVEFPGSGPSPRVVTTCRLPTDISGVINV
jgi:hypothetical protein